MGRPRSAPPMRANPPHLSFVQFRAFPGSKAFWLLPQRSYRLALVNIADFPERPHVFAGQHRGKVRPKLLPPAAGPFHWCSSVFICGPLSLPFFVGPRGFVTSCLCPRPGPFHQWSTSLISGEIGCVSLVNIVAKVVAKTVRTFCQQPLDLPIGVHLWLIYVLPCHAKNVTYDSHATAHHTTLTSGQHRPFLRKSACFCRRTSSPSAPSHLP